MAKITQYPTGSSSGDFSLLGVDAQGNVKRFSKADLAAVFGTGAGGGAPETPLTGFMRGVNLAGAEFTSGGQHPVPMAVDYYITQKKMNVARVPLNWMVMQPTLGGALDATEMEWLTGYVAALNAAGARVIIEPHNSMRRSIVGHVFHDVADDPIESQFIVGETSNVTIAHYVDFWTKLATAIGGVNVIYGLMNEPFEQDDQILLNAHNAAIAAIRGLGRTNLILVNGNNWGSRYYGVGQPNRTYMPQIVDSANNWAIDLHHYLDPLGMGGDASLGSNQLDFLTTFEGWAGPLGIKAFVGEIGFGSDSASLTAGAATLAHIEANKNVYIGWTYWAGGGWWNQDYFTRLDPFASRYDVNNPEAANSVTWSNIVDRPQMQVVQQYLSGASAYNGSTPGANLLLKSNDFVNAVWEGTGLTKTPGSYTGKSAPPTGFNATRLQGGAYSGIYQNTGSTATGTASIYVRSLTGSSIACALYKNASTNVARTITTSWTRIDVVIDANFGRLHLEPAEAYDIEISSAQLNAGSTPTAYQDNS